MAEGLNLENFSTKKLRLIIPFFNEEKRMDRQSFQSAFKHYTDVDFLLIDDQSTDGTFPILTGFQDKFDNVNCFQNDKNIGKAETVRAGVKASKENYTFLGYLDADLATPISELIKLYTIAREEPDKKFVMGSRIKLLGNHVKRSLTRHYLGRVFATGVSQFVLKIPVYDTQCGAKIIETNLAHQLFNAPFETKWLFDVELLLRFRQLDENFDQKTVEIPLETWVEKGDSKIKWYEFLSTPFQMIKLYGSYKK